MLRLESLLPHTLTVPENYLTVEDAKMINGYDTRSEISSDC